MFFLNALLFTTLSFGASPILFTSMTNKSDSLDLLKNNYKTTLMLDEDCSNCADLVKKLGKNCSSFNQKDFTIFATGSKKKLTKKLKPILKRKAVVWYHRDIMTLTKVGVSALPSYISKAGKMFVGYEDSLNAILEDKVCIK
ncbi:MAG: hypothetical protein ACRBBP_08865 [Bdellovibrionales bacterium]